MKLSRYFTFTLLCTVGLAVGFGAFATEPPPVDPTRLPPQGLEAYGWTQLHWLARTGSAESIQAGIDEGYNLEDRDHLDRTPLHLAVMAVNPEAVRTLLEAGADVNAKDQWGVTPLRRAELFAETRGWNMDDVARVLREFGGVKPDRPEPQTITFPVK